MNRIRGGCELVEVRFLPGCGVPDGEQAEIEWVLGTIAVGRGPGRLPPPVHRVEVAGRLTDGRSGAQVLEIRIRHGSPEVVTWYVAKVQGVREARREWAAWTRYLTQLEAAYLTSISAVTEGVLRPGEPVPGGREAVVYQHVSELIGEPGRALVTLERLAADAVDGTAEAGASAALVIGRLLGRLRKTLYRSAGPDTRRATLRRLNPDLGPDLVVEVDNAEGGHLRYQSPYPEQLAAQRVFPKEVLAASCGSDSRRPIEAGQLIAVELSSARLDGDRLLGASQDTVIEIRRAEGAEQRVRLADFVREPPTDDEDADGDAEAAAPPQMLHARVLSTRAQRHWERARAALGDELVRDGTGVRLAGRRIGHPFAQLWSVLFEPAEGRVSSIVHGDLNACNVLVADDQPYLIDHARARSMRPLLGDPAWLELNLLRNVIAPRLSRAELISLYRVSGVYARCTPQGTGPAGPAWPLPGGSAPLRAAAALLHAVRSAARELYPDAGRRPWWREYLGQLTLAAIRTLKWPAREHTAATAAAALVAAGVCGELLDGRETPGASFALWPADELHQVADALLPRLRPEDPDELLLLRDLLAALRSCREPAPAEVAAAAESARDRTVRALCRGAAEERLRELRPRRTTVIALTGTLRPASGAPGSPGGTAADPAARPALDVLAEQTALTVVGRAGAGKSTLLREWEYLSACAVTGEGTAPALPPRMPVLVHAADLAAAIGQGPADEPGTPDGGAPGEHAQVLGRACAAGALLGASTCELLLSLDGLRVLVDGFDELPATERAPVAAWLMRLRADLPGTPLVVCQRTSAYRAAPSGVLRLPVLTLHQVTPEQAGRYMAARRPAGAPPTVWDALLPDGGPPGIATGGASGDRGGDGSEPANGDGGGDGDGDTGVRGGMRELLRTPLFLWMAVESQAALDPPPRTVGELFTAFTGWYLTQRHRTPDDAAPGAGTAPAGLLRLLETVAEHLVERGNATRVPLPDLEALLDGGPPEWRAGLAQLLDAELLVQEGGTVRFLHQLFQEYFAARALVRTATTDEAGLLRRMLRFEWQESVRMLVGFPDTPADTVGAVLATAAGAHPGYAAWLIRESLAPRAEAVAAFVADQGAVLAGPAAGGEAHRRAATALAVLREDPAWRLLARVAADPAAPAQARTACLDALAGALRPGSGGAAGGGAARAAAEAVLRQEAPADAEIAALRIVGRSGAAALSGYAWERIGPGVPWPVAREASAALAALGVELTPRARAAQVSACLLRLAQADEEAGRAARAGDTAALTAERAELLAALGRSGSPEALHPLLDHRFRYGLADLPDWSGLLLDAARARSAAHPGDPAADLLLAADGGAAPEDVRQRALSAFGDAQVEEPAAVAAAHLLLSDRATPPRDLLELVGTGSSHQRLLAAAAAVESLDPAELGTAERLVRELIGTPGTGRPQRLEPLAALVGAVGRQSHVLRVRLAHAVARGLEGEDAEAAARGPWAHAYYEAEIDHKVLVELLEQPDAESAELALRYMSGVDFLLTASGRPEPLPLSGEARDRLLALRPADGSASPAQLLRYILAVAYAGLTEASPFVSALTDPPPTTQPGPVPPLRAAAWTPVAFAHSRFGVLDMPPAAHAAAAAGWFGRLAGEEQDLDAVEEAHARLLQLDARGEPSLVRARLVGLGLLGNWRMLLAGLVPGDPVLHEAAAHVVLGWCPAPWQSEQADGPEAVARWITARLESGRVADPEVREVLAGVAAALGQRLQRYFVPSHAASRGTGAAVVRPRQGADAARGHR